MLKGDSVWSYRLWRWRREIRQAAEYYSLDQALIAAIMDRESLGGDALTPLGPQGTGDGGHGKGLMQIDDRSHPEFCADIKLWGDPSTNILKGAEVMAWARSLCKDHTPGIPAIYNSGWSRKGEHWIREVYDINPAPSVADLDHFTAGHDYVADVLKRYTLLQKSQFS